MRVTSFHDHLIQTPWVVLWLRQLGLSVGMVSGLDIIVDIRPKYECEEGWSSWWPTYTHTILYLARLTFTDGSSECKTFTKQDFRIARRLAEKQRRVKQDEE